MHPTPDQFTIATRLAYSHGLLKQTDSSTALLSCTLLPSPFPNTILDLAKCLQRDFNLLFHKVALDHDFLERIFRHVVGLDPYIGRLWEIYMRVREKPNAQRIFLGLNRSDYMLDQRAVAMVTNGLAPLDRLRRLDQAVSKPVSSDQSWSGLTLRQVEFNLMASSFCGLGPRIADLHRSVLGLLNYPKEALERIPICDSAEKFANTLAMAQKLYCDQTQHLCNKSSRRSCAILMVVATNESNVFDQTALIDKIFALHPHVPVLVQTLEQLERDNGRMRLDEHQRLFVNDCEVAVVYFRAGYVPAHFPREETWDVKYQLESSLAIKCPCIQYMLANTKIIQAALSKPENLSRFLAKNDPAYTRILSTFAEQFTLSDVFGLSDSTEIQRAVEDCLAHPDKFVLKPQREGGGNNHFDADLVHVLKKILKTEERCSYVLMQRLYPFVFENYILDPKLPVQLQDMVSELGVYGTFIGQDSKIYLNETAGQILRSKKLKSSEGGIVAGYGYLDSPFLV